MNALANKRVVVAMSGGVDSSVVAAMMLEQGASVVGVTFRFFESDSSEHSIIDAQEVAKKLNIEHHVIDCVDLFKKNVLDYYEQTRSAGATPSPCVMCNPMVKFKALFESMHAYDADMIATGHYVRLDISDDHIILKTAIDRSKDQSYFLYRVNREILKKCVFPLGNMVNKNETRSLADSYGIHVAEKSDSQDVCFMNTKWYRDFMQSGKNGDIETEEGIRVGEHKGSIHYTIGQRKGLGLAGGPYFVRSVDSELNRIIVSKERPERHDISLDRMVFINEPIQGTCFAKIRSQGDIVECNVECNIVHLTKPDCAAPGQHCVLYNKEYEVLGGGIIAPHK